MMIQSSVKSKQKLDKHSNFRFKSKCTMDKMIKRRPSTEPLTSASNYNTPRGLSRLTSRSSKANLRPHTTNTPRTVIRSAGVAAVSVKTWKTSLLNKHLGAEDNREKAIDKFRRMAKSVSLISAICVVIRRYAQKGAQMEWETIQTNLKLFAEFDSMIAFNFASPVTAVPIRTKAGERIQRVMGQAPEERTIKDIQAIQWLLKENDAFQGYPLATQIELCKCVEYRRYEARRIVVRQGHIPEAFYIVLSGTVISNIREGGKPVVKEISAGGTFGEKSLIEGNRRTYTVVCKTDVELITIMKEDFERIIKGPQLQQKERHLDYLRSLSLFEHFPLDKLSNGSNSFYHKYVRKGKEVASSRSDFEYLVIIQTGSCQIVTDIPCENIRPHTSVERNRGSQDIAANFPIVYHKQQKEKQHRSKSADVLHWETGAIRDTMRANILTGNTSPDKVMKIWDPRADVALNWIKERKGLSVIQDRLEQLRRQRIKLQSVMAAKQDEKFTISFTDRFAGIHKNDEAQKLEIKKGIGRTFRRMSYAAKALPVTQTTSIPQTVKEESSGSSPSRAQPSGHTTSQEQPAAMMSAQLATVGAGSVFGLEGLFHNYPITVRLISEGAECIFLSKKVFLKDCNAEVLQKISELIISYPSRDYIQHKLEEKRSWDRYKKSVMRDLVRRKQTLSSQR